MQTIERILHKEQNKLSYERFKNTLKEAVQEQMGNEAEVYLREMEKNNHKKEAITFCQTGINAVPVIYLDDMYEQYQNGKSMEQCLVTVLEIVKTKGDVNTEEFLGEWNQIKERIRLYVVNVEWNKERLTNFPHRKFLDLAVVFYLEVENFLFGRAKCDITYETMKTWGVSENELWETAWNNLQNTSFKIKDLEEIVMEMLGIEQEVPIAGGLQYVMTNTKRYYGAVGMLRADLLKEFAEEINGSFFILPSSIHELILLPDRGEFSEGQLKAMVREVNETQLSIEERLSDEVYYFDRERQSLCVGRGQRSHVFSA